VGRRADATRRREAARIRRRSRSVRTRGARCRRPQAPERRPGLRRRRERRRDVHGARVAVRRDAGRPPPAGLADDETERIARGIAAGLAHAHAHGLVHRDLKPANILFDAEDRPRIADFGIARLGDDGTLTEAGTVLGTAATISPEQAAGEPATPASDVYSFGVIVYRMLTGRLPFEADDALTVAAMHLRETPQPIDELRPDAPARLESTVTAALAKDPADRPSDGAALLAELGGATRLAPPPGQAARRRFPALAALGALLLLAAAGGAVALVAAKEDTPAPAPAASTAPVPATTQPTAPTVTNAAPTTQATTPATTRSTTAATTTQNTTTAPATTAPATTRQEVPTEPPPILTDETVTEPPPDTVGTTVTIP
jgi:hypothetical protein